MSAWLLIQVMSQNEGSIGLTSSHGTWLMVLLDACLLVGLSMPCCLALSTIICPLRNFWRGGSEAVQEGKAQCTGCGSLIF